MTAENRPAAAPSNARPERVPLDQFRWDEAAGVYVHPHYRGFAYSDGSATEEHLYQAIAQAKDRSLFSPELQAHITDWASEYHLSEQRHNLLRHFAFAPTDRILELGAGCGAITRQFGESGASVTAIEGSLLRARSAALRSRDLPNVQVYCSDFQQIHFTETFDYVTLIGVLEYSPVFFPDADPFAACLALARNALKPHGKLLIAIENRLGLKYFLGMSEDHIGKPYVGLEDVYTPKTARTLGPEEMRALLRRCGFASAAFQYPFPDYKLPVAVFTEEAFLVDAFAPGEIIRQIPSRDYTVERNPAASERLVWPQIAANFLVPALANSFLGIASPLPYPSAAIAAQEETPLAYLYATTRRPVYKTATVFQKARPGNIVVIKRRLLPAQAEPSGTLQHIVGRSDYVEGVHFESELVKRMYQNDVEGFLAGCRQWIACLDENGLAESSGGGKAAIQPEFYDCIPRNLILHGDSLAYIDREWRFLPACARDIVIVRGLFYLLGSNLDYVARSGTTLGSLLSGWLARLGITLDEALIEAFIAAESAFHEAVHGNGKVIPGHIRRHLRWSRRSLGADTCFVRRANRFLRRKAKAILIRLGLRHA